MRRIEVLAVITAILASVALVAAPSALADGDPASDVLVQNRLFNPIDSGVSPASQARLEAMLGASARAGFPIRVALIASETDLGTATSLWRDPKDYARYLWIELSELYGGQVLVIMPSGFGLYGNRSGAHAVTAAELGVRAAAPGPGPQLATAAGSAVPLLARAAGHPIPASALGRRTDRATLGEKVAVGDTFSQHRDCPDPGCASDRRKLGSQPARPPAPASDGRPPREVADPLRGDARPRPPAPDRMGPLVLPIAVAVLYFAWRIENVLAKLRTAARGLMLRGELRGIRISPLALVPTALLLIVIVVLVITR